LYAQQLETKNLCAFRDAIFEDALQQAAELNSISSSQLGRSLNQNPTFFFQSLFLDLLAQIYEKARTFNKAYKQEYP